MRTFREFCKKLNEKSEFNIVAENYYDSTIPDIPKNKEAEKVHDFISCANEYHYQTGESLRARDMANNYESQHGKEHPLTLAHFYKHASHHHFAKNHADKLVKEHGASHQSIKDAYAQHPHSQGAFTVALASARKK